MLARTGWRPACCCSDCGLLRSALRMVQSAEARVPSIGKFLGLCLPKTARYTPRLWRRTGRVNVLFTKVHGLRAADRPAVRPARKAIPSDSFFLQIPNRLVLSSVTGSDGSGALVFPVPQQNHRARIGLAGCEVKAQIPRQVAHAVVFVKYIGG